MPVQLLQPTRSRTHDAWWRAPTARTAPDGDDGETPLAPQATRQTKRETSSSLKTIRIDPSPVEGYDFSDEGFVRACKAAVVIAENLQDEERAFLEKLTAWGSRFEAEVPLVNVPIVEDAYATLLWPEKHVLLISEADEEVLFEKAGGPCEIGGWQILHLSEADLSRCMDLPKGDSEWLA